MSKQIDWNQYIIKNDNSGKSKILFLRPRDSDASENLRYQIYGNEGETEILDIHFFYNDKKLKEVGMYTGMLTHPTLDLNKSLVETRTPHTLVVFTPNKIARDYCTSGPVSVNECNTDLKITRKRFEALEKILATYIAQQEFHQH